MYIMGREGIRRNERQVAWLSEVKIPVANASIVLLFMFSPQNLKPGIQVKRGERRGHENARLDDSRKAWSCGDIPY